MFNMELQSIPYSTAILNLSYEKDRFYFGPFWKDSPPPGLKKLDSNGWQSYSHVDDSVLIAVPPVSSDKAGLRLILEDASSITNEGAFHRLCAHMATKESGARLNLPANSFSLHGSKITTAYGIYSPNSMSFAAESNIDYPKALSPSVLPCCYPNILYQYTLYNRVYWRNYVKASGVIGDVFWRIFYVMLYQHTPSYAGKFLEIAHRAGGSAAYDACPYQRKEIVLKHTKKVVENV